MKNNKKAIGKIAIPVSLSKEEKLKREYKKKLRELRIARTRASVLRIQIIKAYEILENIRFDFLGDTMFRDYIVGAKRELEGAICDYLLSDNFWEKQISEHRYMTAEEYHKKVNQPSVNQSTN